MECVRHYPGGSSSKVVETLLKTVALHTEATGEHIVHVRASGASIATDVDGKRVDELQDGSVRSGTIGIVGVNDPKAVFAATIHEMSVEQTGKAAVHEDFAENHNSMTGGVMTKSGILIPNAASAFAPTRDIVFPLTTPAPLLRKQFTLVQRPVKARFFVAVGGFAKIHLNGSAVSHSAMENDLTAYNKRVLYRTYDVTKMLHQGTNVLTAELGRGRYGLTTPSEWYWNMAPWHANPTLKVQLEVTYQSGANRQSNPMRPGMRRTVRPYLILFMEGKLTIRGCCHKAGRARTSRIPLGTTRQPAMAPRVSSYRSRLNLSR